MKKISSEATSFKQLLSYKISSEATSSTHLLSYKIINSISYRNVIGLRLAQ